MMIYKKLFFLSLFFCFSLSAQTLLRSGPMVGYGQMTEVLLWIQTTEPCTVQYRYWDKENPEKKMLSENIHTTKENVFVAKTLINNLLPGKKYEYELLINGNLVSRSHPLKFQTQPLWQWRTDPPAFSVAFGSCAYINETEWDRPGKPYGSDYEIFRTIAQQQPDLMLWLGDNFYYREIDWNTVSGLQHRATHDRAIPELQPLLGSTHHYAIWDDHDYGPNDADKTYRLRSESLENFKLFWANQTHGTEETKGVFQRFEWNDVEFFMLDDRYYRSPNNAPNDSTKTMFGKEQLQWLKDALVSSTATFKIIVNGNQMLNTYSKYETFPLFDFEYKDLIRYIKQQKISGIIFLSGDRHYAELLCDNDKNFYPLYDFTSSSLTAGLNNKPDENNDTRVQGTVVSDSHNFGMLRFSGPRKNRKVILECYDIQGKLRWSKDVLASELQVKK